MKKLLITGASGSLGHALFQRLTAKEEVQYELLLTGSKEDQENGIRKLDITEESEVNKFILEHRPDYIINCAAYTAVDLCEDELDKAYLVNADGPKYLAKAAEQVEAVLVHISTDYIFSGDAKSPYKEEEKPNPKSVYGRTKLAGEEAVLTHCSRAFILRTEWLYGVKKSFVNVMLRLAESGNPIRVVNDQIGAPTSADELAKAILHILPSKQYGIINVTCQGEASWYDFAKYIFECTGKKVETIPIPTKEYPAKAVRPAYSLLDATKLREVYGFEMAHWKKALREHLKKEGLLVATKGEE